MKLPDFLKKHVTPAQWKRLALDDLRRDHRRDVVELLQSGIAGAMGQEDLLRDLLEGVQAVCDELRGPEKSTEGQSEVFRRFDALQRGRDPDVECIGSEPDSGTVCGSAGNPCPSDEAEATSFTIGRIRWVKNLFLRPLGHGVIFYHDFTLEEEQPLAFIEGYTWQDRPDMIVTIEILEPTDTTPVEIVELPAGKKKAASSSGPRRSGTEGTVMISDKHPEAWGRIVRDLQEAAEDFLRSPRNGRLTERVWCHMNA